MSGGIIALLILVAVGVIVLSIYADHVRARRTNEIAAWALTKRLTFSPEEVRGLEKRFPAFECLHQTDGRARNTMEGDYSGRAMLAFDYTGYRYQGISIDPRTNRERVDDFFSAVILFSKVPLEPLLIRPKGLLNKIGVTVGFEDISFESAEFSRKFFVKSPDRKWAYDVLHAKTIEFLLAMPQYNVQFDSRCVIVWRDSRFDPPEFLTAAMVIKGILDRLPEYVVQQQHELGRNDLINPGRFGEAEQNIEGAV